MENLTYKEGLNYWRFQPAKKIPESQTCNSFHVPEGLMKLHSPCLWGTDQIVAVVKADLKSFI